MGALGKINMGCGASSQPNAEAPAADTKIAENVAKMKKEIDAKTAQESKQPPEPVYREIDGVETRIITAAQKQVFQEKFNKFDKDGTGQLDPNGELKLLITDQLGTEPGADELGFWISMLDRDADGRIGLDEYLKSCFGVFVVE